MECHTRACPRISRVFTKHKHKASDIARGRKKKQDAESPLSGDQKITRINEKGRAREGESERDAKKDIELSGIITPRTIGVGSSILVKERVEHTHPDTWRISIYPLNTHSYSIHLYIFVYSSILESCGDENKERERKKRSDTLRQLGRANDRDEKKKNCRGDKEGDKEGKRCERIRG